jgi:hypothetical protein
MVPVPDVTATAAAAPGSAPAVRPLAPMSADRNRADFDP